MHNTPSAFGSASCLSIGNCTGTDIGIGKGACTDVDADADEGMVPKGLEVTSLLSSVFEISLLRVDPRPMTRIGSRPRSILNIVLFPDPVKWLTFIIKKKQAIKKDT